MAVMPRYTLLKSNRAFGICGVGSKCIVTTNKLFFTLAISVPFELITSYA
ncbi:Unknown protein sequence [Pseudomonas savastanoi pv. glycinea]|nr:Unknown protein sequence [Pseudomonas savastanoi pv. glycinea]